MPYVRTVHTRRGGALLFSPESKATEGKKKKGEGKEKKKKGGKNISHVERRERSCGGGCGEHDPNFVPRRSISRIMPLHLSYHPSHAIQDNNTIILGTTFLIARNRLPNASHDSQQQEMSILVVCPGGITPKRKEKTSKRRNMCAGA
jgi:hypothetical protein